MTYITYTYTRAKITGDGYDVNNTSRIDGGSKQIYLAKEIEAAFSGKKFKVRANGAVLKILVETADGFTSEEKTTLDGIVSDHKKNA